MCAIAQTIEKLTATLPASQRRSHDRVPSKLGSNVQKKAARPVNTEAALGKNVVEHLKGGTQRLCEMKGHTDTHTEILTCAPRVFWRARGGTQRRSGAVASSVAFNGISNVYPFCTSDAPLPQRQHMQRASSTLRLLRSTAPESCIERLTPRSSSGSVKANVKFRGACDVRRTRTWMPRAWRRLIGPSHPNQRLRRRTRHTQFTHTHTHTHTHRCGQITQGSGINVTRAHTTHGKVCVQER